MDNELLQLTQSNKLNKLNLIYNRAHHLLHIHTPTLHLNILELYSKEPLQEIINDRFNLILQILRKRTLFRNLFQHRFLIRSQMSKKFSFILRNTINRDFIKI